MKFGLAILVLGIIAFSVYSFTSKPDFEAAYEMDKSSLAAKVMSAEIYPKSVYSGNSLNIRMQKATKDEYRYLQVRWFKNGHVVPSEAGPKFPSRLTNKGDRIYAEINLLGIDELEVPVKTSEIVVLNSPPAIVTGSLILRTEPTDMIVARIEASDGDKDRLKFTYQWFRNGSPIQGQRKKSLPLANYGQGDTFHVVVTASDGENSTAPYKTEPMELGSNAPTITSQPPGSFTPDRHYIYQVVVSGGNTETLQYEVKGPSGMKISSTGMLDWELPEQAVGSREYTIVVRVSDATGGAVSQEFSLNLSAQARNDDGY